MAWHDILPASRVDGDDDWLLFRNHGRGFVLCHLHQCKPARISAETLGVGKCEVEINCIETRWVSTMKATVVALPISLIAAPKSSLPYGQHIPRGLIA